MRLLMICDFFHEDFEYQENLLARYYQKAGYKIIIVASTFTSVFEYYANNYKRVKGSEVQSKYGYCLIRKPYAINIFNKIRKLKDLDRILGIYKPDMIYVHGTLLNLGPSIQYKIQSGEKCILIYDFHGDYSNSASNWISLYVLHGLIFRRILKRYLSAIDRFFYVTPNGGKFLKNVYKVPEGKISLLPLGADMDRIREIKMKNYRSKIRDALGIMEDDFVVFTGGRISRVKKTHMVIQAVASMENSSIHLIIIGDCEDSSYRKELMDISGNESRIHHIGWLKGDSIYHYMSACDIAVFPASQSVLWQQSIGFGMPLIVGYSHAQDPGYLNKNNNIILLRGNSLSSVGIMNKLEHLRKNSELFNSMRANAEKTAKEYLSYEKISAETLRKY